MCARPWPRTPTQATRTVSFALARPLGRMAAAPAAIEPIKKCLRFMIAPFVRMYRIHRTAMLLTESRDRAEPFRARHEFSQPLQLDNYLRQAGGVEAASSRPVTLATHACMPSGFRLGVAPRFADNSGRDSHLNEPRHIVDAQ